MATSANRLAIYVAGAVCVLALGVFLWRAKEDPKPPKRVTAERVAPEPERVPEIVRPVSPTQDRASLEDLAAAPSASAVSTDLAESQPDAEADDRFANRNVEALMDRLSSDDQHLVLDSADGLRARKAVEAIPKLASLDIAQHPDSARGVIKALGELAGAADADDREVATDRLIALLAQEKARDAPDAPGNVLQIYEALGQTGDPRAAAALEPELSDRTVPLAALTVVADALANLGQPSSVAALAEAHARVAALAFDDAFLSEVQKDVIASIDRALASLRTGQQ